MSADVPLITVGRGGIWGASGPHRRSLPPPPVGEFVIYLIKTELWIVTKSVEFAMIFDHDKRENKS